MCWPFICGDILRPVVAVVRTSYWSAAQWMIVTRFCEKEFRGVPSLKRDNFIVYHHLVVEI